MKHDIYSCDRCGKEMRLQEGRKPNQLTSAYNGEVEWGRDLCADCSASLEYFLDTKTFKKFDDIAEAIAIDNSKGQ